MKKILLYTIAVLALAGCISNDIPYPVLVPNITSLEVDGSEKVDIDYAKRTVTIYFPETADLRSVNITSVSFDKEKVTSSVGIVGVHDLSSSNLLVTLHTYDDYLWRIKAVRDIERYFTVKGQVGSSAIDSENCRVIVSVSKKTDLENIEVTSMKLGPKDGVATYSPSLSEIVGSAIDFTQPYQVEVTAFDLTEVWDIYVSVVESSVSLGKVNPWTTEAYVKSTGVAGMENGFQYRKLGADVWTDVPESDITSDGGSFLAHIKNLEPETAYEVLAYCGTDRTNPVSFTTYSAPQMPNSSFEYSSLVTGQSFYKFYDPNCGVEGVTTKFWASGNGDEESTGLLPGGFAAITVPDNVEKVDGNWSVRAQSMEVMGLKLAAGNLFTGRFVQTEGTNGGVVNFGRPWTTRPTAIRLWCKYTTGNLGKYAGTAAGMTLSESDYDRAQIKVALGTWNPKTYGGDIESPVQINTTKENTFVDFYNDTKGGTIANGDIVIYHDGYDINRGGKKTEDTGVWKEYTIPIVYNDMDVIPTHIIISCSASQYGDYFVGSTSSRLWLDDFELIY